jgi:hypothetical protein
MLCRDTGDLRPQLAGFLRANQEEIHGDGNGHPLLFSFGHDEIELHPPVSLDRLAAW